MRRGEVGRTTGREGRENRKQGKGKWRVSRKAGVSAAQRQEKSRPAWLPGRPSRLRSYCQLDRCGMQPHLLRLLFPEITTFRLPRVQGSRACFFPSPALPPVCKVLRTSRSVKQRSTTRTQPHLFHSMFLPLEPLALDIDCTLRERLAPMSLPLIYRKYDVGRAAF